LQETDPAESRTAGQATAVLLHDLYALLPGVLGETVAEVFEQGFQLAAEVDRIKLGVL
jgi:hypothetical protein